jgi:hypothetical protein
MSEIIYNGDTKEGLESFWLDLIKELSQDNLKQKELAEKRENLLFDYGNRTVECNDLVSLQKLKVSVLRFRSITVQTKNWRTRELQFSFKGVDYYRERYDSKTYEETLEEIDSILTCIDNKIKLVEIQKDQIIKENRCSNIGIKDGSVKEQLPDDIYDIFKFVGIDLNLVMTEMTKTTFGDNDLIFVQRNKENQLEWNTRGRNGCIMIISALIMHLSDILHARPELKYTDRQLITSFKNCFNYINESSICPTRAKEYHKAYVTRIIKAVS